MRAASTFVTLLVAMFLAAGPVTLGAAPADAEQSRYAAAKKKKKNKKKGGKKKKKKKKKKGNPLGSPVTLIFRGAGAIQLDDEYSGSESGDCRINTNIFRETVTDVQWEIVWENLQLVDNANVDADEAVFSATMNRSAGTRVNLSACTPGQTFNNCVAPDPDCLLVSSGCTDAELEYLEGVGSELQIEQQGNAFLITVEAEQVLNTIPGEGTACFGSTLFDNAIAEHVTRTQFLLTPKPKGDPTGIELILEPLFDCTDPARQTSVNVCTITNNLTATLEVSGKWNAVAQ